MKKQDLPISPHLQIYKPQITSILSISHRITGFALNLSLVVMVYGLFSLSLGEKYFNFFLDFVSSIPMKVILYLTILGFSYHLLNGIRHIFWDFGFFLENKLSAALGYVIIICSFTLSILISILLGLFL
tara:strand:- start:51 stop:437 length:387 start_codon:yes stop_codon:yes gene_type:complete